MLKFVKIYTSKGFKISKKEVHNLIGFLREELDFKIALLEINFVDLETIISVNSTYMKHNYPTDIVTLDFSAEIDRLDSELFISYDVAKENAVKYKVTLNEELIRLIIHGILHVTGYDDTTEKEKKKMKKIENFLTNKYSFLALNAEIK